MGLVKLSPAYSLAMALTAEELIEVAPHLHGFNPSGEAERWGLHPEVLRLIDRFLQPGMRTLETGAGVSTILFALNATHHECVSPDRGEMERITEFCGANGISTDRLNFILNVSEAVLPQLDSSDFDLVLLDGSHSFPSVFIDWFYTADKLRVGGWLVVDDTNIWTGRVLRDFLSSEAAWELSEEVPMRTAIFEKITATTGVENWMHQPYVVTRSFLTSRNRAVVMLRDRHFGALLEKGRKRLFGRQ